MSAVGPLLILTMPGFGIETLRHLMAHPAWPPKGVELGLVGRRPSPWRRIAADIRRTLLRPADRLHRLADGTLAASAAERFMRERQLSWRWLPDDDAVRKRRAALCPSLTLTITSRVLFTARTLDDTPGDWFNVHPGLLPEYAGASPGPYMFLDGVGGCTIHRMVARVDAGAVIDRAPMQEPLGEDGGAYFFQRLPAHTAARIGALLQRWRAGEPWPSSLLPDLAALRHCSSRRLARDRQLDWHWSPQRLTRWVTALAAMAPAWFDVGSGRQVEVMAAAPVALAGVSDSLAVGTVQLVRGRWVEIACRGGAIALRCRKRPALSVGDRLPLPAVKDTT